MVQNRARISGLAYSKGMRPAYPARDRELVQIVDDALASAVSRAGTWLACRPGCTQCCHGVFAISQLDAARLRAGFAALAALDPARADRIRQRTAASAHRLRHGFPGDPDTGTLGETDQDRALFEAFADEEPCPVLDPASGTCDLYASRPLTCRIFGPPVLGEQGLGMCELCYVGASEAEITSGEMHLTHHALEEDLTREAEQTAGRGGSTVVAFALVQS